MTSVVPELPTPKRQVLLAGGHERWTSKLFISMTGPSRTSSVPLPSRRFGCSTCRLEHPRALFPCASRVPRSDFVQLPAIIYCIRPGNRGQPRRSRWYWRTSSIVGAEQQTASFPTSRLHSSLEVGEGPQRFHRSYACRGVSVLTSIAAGVVGQDSPFAWRSSTDQTTPPAGLGDHANSSAPCPPGA